LQFKRPRYRGLNLMSLAGYFSKNQRAQISLSTPFWSV